MLPYVAKDIAADAAQLRTSRWAGDPGLPGWAQCHHEGPWKGGQKGQGQGEMVEDRAPRQGRGSPQARERGGSGLSPGQPVILLLVTHLEGVSEEVHDVLSVRTALMILLTRKKLRSVQTADKVIKEMC